METILNSLASMPWYAWVAIVAIVCAAAVKIAAGRRKA